MTLHAEVPGGASVHLAAQRILEEPIAFIPVDAHVTRLIQDLMGELLDEIVAAMEADPENWRFYDTFTDDIGEPDDGVWNSNHCLRRNGTRKDDKINVHFRRWLPLLLRSRGIDPDLFNEYMGRSLELFEFCSRLFEQVSLSLGRLVPDFDAHHQVVGLHGRTDVLRTNIYRGIRDDSATNVIGDDHLDRSFLTFPLGESIPGLYIEGQGVVPMRDGHVILMRGKYCRHLINRPGALHGARATEAFDKERVRRMMVFFGKSRMIG